MEWLGRLVSRFSFPRSRRHNCRPWAQVGLAGRVTSEKGERVTVRLSADQMDLVVKGGPGETHRLHLRLAIGQFFTDPIDCKGTRIYPQS